MLAPCPPGGRGHILGRAVIKVVLAEDNLLVREGLVRLLEDHPEIQVTAACAEYDSLVETVEADPPDAVLTDIRMPPTDSDEGIRAAARFRETAPSVGVVVLSQHDEAEYALALLERGSEGRAYLLKERVSDPGQLVGALRAVAAGGSVIDPKVVEALVAARSRSERSPLAALTPREMEIISEIAQGKTNAGIASTLFLTERAVEKHINSIFSKLQLSGDKDSHRRVKAVLLFLSR